MWLHVKLNTTILAKLLQKAFLFYMYPLLSCWKVRRHTCGLATWEIELVSAQTLIEVSLRS